jgi:hypothetical protein
MHVVAPHRVAVVDSRILFGFRELAHAIKRSMPQSDTVRRAVP